VKWYFRDTSYNSWPIVLRHPQAHSNFAFGVGVDLHLHGVHFLVIIAEESNGDFVRDAVVTTVTHTVITSALAVFWYMAKKNWHFGPLI